MGAIPKEPIYCYENLNFEMINLCLALIQNLHDFTIENFQFRFIFYKILKLVFKSLNKKVISTPKKYSDVTYFSVFIFTYLLIHFKDLGEPYRYRETDVSL